MKNNILFLLIGTILLGLSSCVKDTFDAPPACEEPTIAANMTIADLKSLYTGAPIEIMDDIIIEGVLNSDDASGNFYKTLTFQDATAGIAFIIDATGMNAEYPNGRKIWVKCQGLFLGDYNGLIQLGGSLDPSDPGSILRLSQNRMEDHIVKSCSYYPVDTLETTIDLLNNSHQNMLIKLNNVEFVNGEAGVQQYADYQSNTNRHIQDCSGNEVLLRTSGYSSFFSDTLPTGNGSITAVYSVFGTDAQLYIRDTRDVNMTNTRCDGGGGGGNSIISEDFASYTMGSFSTTEPSGWLNYAEEGTQLWEFGSHNSSAPNYAKASNFSSGEVSTFWLVTPSINMDAYTNEKFSFRIAAAYFDGATLECLISSDYDGDGTPETGATWITLPANIPSGGTFFDWQDGLLDHDLSGYTGTIYIAWKYSGDDSADDNMTFEIDNIEITGDM